MAKSSSASNSNGLAPDSPLQGLPFEQLHGNEELAFRFIDVYGADVWMIEGRCCLRFALETPQGRNIRSQTVGQRI